MSNENIVCSHELLVRFDQSDDGGVTWYVLPDESVRQTRQISYDDLAAAGIPLSALGVRVLSELLVENLIQLALDKANGYLWKECYRKQSLESLPAPDDVDEAILIDGYTGAVIH